VAAFGFHAALSGQILLLALMIYSMASKVSRLQTRMWQLFEALLLNYIIKIKQLLI
jgi:hypothetical protein